MHIVEAKGILSAKNGMNLYRGCSHGCIYCDSRSSVYHMDHDFEDIEIKGNAIELLEAALKRKRSKCMDKLCVVDHYPSDRFTFSSHGYDLHIENELVADAFAGLSVQEQSILILHFVLDLPDQEVGRLVGMSRSAVQRRRAKSLTELRIKLAALMPKGG